MRVHEISPVVTSQKIQNLAKLLTEKYGDGQGCEANNTVFVLQEGKRYIKIIRQYCSGGTNSVYGFVEKETGNIFKAATWRAPAKHVRGNVHDADNGMGCCNRFSIVYLR